jgi:ubiquinone/menaquinone biosynthesis C-methylase UbiE
MAAGYATARPPVHAIVLDKVREAFCGRMRPRTALDVGCGAGLSTKPLTAFVEHCIGLEPAVSMLKFARTVVPGARFVSGVAESLPFRSGSIDLMTAAGSLNYVSLNHFFPEALRVLDRSGCLVVYDYPAGRNFHSSEDLDLWFGHFRARYPKPPSEALKLTPEILERIVTGFRLGPHEYFETCIKMTCQAYAAYMMSETNVAKAIREGESEEAIRNWVESTLPPVFDGREREIVFKGYYACLEPARGVSSKHFQ